jgi:hypothetical protein
MKQMIKQLLFFTVTALAILSCSKDKTGITSNNFQSINNAPEKLSGQFIATAGIAVQGNAKIFSDGNGFTLVLDGFQINSGPDLKVYLSKKETPFEFINLGSLKNIVGNQTYSVPAGVDLSIYKYVLIHCQQYNHLFAIAALKP